MKYNEFPAQPIVIKNNFSNSCKSFLRTSQSRTIILTLLTSFVLTQNAYAQKTCESLFTESNSIQKTQVTDLNSFGKAMTEGMLLAPEQSDIFEVYRKVFFGDSNTSVDGKTLKSVTEILKKHPELTKPMFTEFNISTVEKIYETPEALAKYIRSQTSTAGQVRSNLFQIDANLGYWKKLLDYQDIPTPEGLTKDQQKDFQKKSKERFVTYLNRIINKTNRDLLADLKNENTTYTQKAQALFETLRYLESWMQKKDRNTQPIRQAMLDLVYTVGYGNKSSLDLLKSPNGTVKIQGLQQLWAEADGFAEAVGYKNHFTELKQKLKIDFPTGLSKNEDPQLLIKHFDLLVQQSNFTTKPTNSIRVRSLSIQESPFRSCLGKDCSTRTYFDKALDPNYIYFTMTDSSYKSDGHATLVLGTAINKQNGHLEKVAFLDKLQNIPTTMIELFLNAVDQSLQTKGYHLAIPTYLGKDIPGHGGISNMDVITDFVQQNIMPRLNQLRPEFTPQEHQFQFKNAYSRGDKKLEVRIFEGKPLDQNTEIRKGNEVQSYPSDATLNKEQLAQQVLKLKDSENSEDIIKFISLSEGIVKLGLYTKDQLSIDLDHIAGDTKRPLKIRKLAMYQKTSMASDIAKELGDFLEKLSDQDLNQTVNELLSFKNSSHASLKKLSNEMTFPNYLSSPRVISALIKNKFDINALDNNGQAAIHVAAQTGHKDIIEFILKQPGIDLNTKNKFGNTALHYAAVKGHKDIVELILKQPSVDLNAKDQLGDTALHFAAVKGHKDFFELILKQPGVDLNAKNRSGDTALILAAEKRHKDIVEFLVKQPGVDLNAKSHSGDTALIWAAQNGNKDLFEFIVKQPGVDLNAKSHCGNTALNWAAQNGHKDIVEFLVKQPGVDLNIKGLFGNTALIWAAQKRHKDIFKLISKQPGVDLNAKDENGLTLLLNATLASNKEMFEFLMTLPGVDQNAKYKDGKTALDLAFLRGWIK